MASAKKMTTDLGRLLGRSRKSGDAKAIHDLRKTAARLRAYCELLGDEVLAGDLRWLRRSAADLRDIDVVLDLEPPAALAEWLREERSRRLRRFRRATRGTRSRALRAELARLPRLRRRRAKRGIARSEADARDCASGLGSKSPARDFHALRRALRRLRLRREWADRRTKEVERVLERLGELNDLARARRFAEECPARRSLAGWRGDLDKTITKASRKALALSQDYK